MNTDTTYLWEKGVGFDGRTTEYAVENVGTRQPTVAENANPTQTTASTTNKTNYLVKTKQSSLG